MNVEPSQKDFFTLCKQLKKDNRKQVSSIYNSFAYMRFIDTYEQYEIIHKESGQSSNEIKDKRAELIAYSCFSNFKELNNSIKAEDQHKVRKLGEFAQELAQEKSIKRIAMINFVGELRRIEKFHQDLLRESQ